MRKYLLTIAVALALSVAAQAQETVKHIVVKNVDNTSYEIPIKSVSEISFIDETETVPVSNDIRRASSVTTSTFVAKPFRVSKDKTVYFSRGNLQYQPSTGIWSFAEHQYDIIGENNKNISDTYTGWIDLFGWGTANDPTNSSESDSAYPSFADWGARFGNGNTWYTLTNEEWAYFVRNHKNKWLKVNGVWGRVYLPDGATISIDSDWTKLEAAGAVFLPAAGCRNGIGLSNINVAGFYWSCDKYLTPYGLGLNLGAGNNWVGCADSRHQGQSVRLVRTAGGKTDKYFDGHHYELVFSDEFNLPDGSRPNTAVWSCPKLSNAPWNRWVVDSSAVVFIKDGKLVCRAIPDTADPTKMLTGAVYTKDRYEFRYGKVEVRMKTNMKNGNWPAAWLSHWATPEEPLFSEIDIVEVSGTRDVSHTAHSELTTSNKNHGQPYTFNYPVEDSDWKVSDWHVYGVIWDEKSIVWTVDGVKVHEYLKSDDQVLLDKGQWSFDYDLFIVLNQSVGVSGYGDFFEPQTNEVYETQFDWVRVYKEK